MTHSVEQIQNINDLYELYRTTPEGLRISQILDKLDRYCSMWMLGEHDNVHSWFFMKKILLVQILEKGFVDDEDDPNCSYS